MPPGGESGQGHRLFSGATRSEKLFSANPKIGFFAGAADLAAKLAAGTLSPDKAAVAGKLIFNQRLDAALTAFFLFVLWAVILDMLRIAWRRTSGAPVPSSPEAAYQRSRLVEGASA